MKILFYFELILMRISFLILKLFHCKIHFVGKCCCRNLKILEVKGTSGNQVIFDEHVVLKNCIIRFEGTNHTLHFGKGIKLENVSFFFEKDNSSIDIGDGTWIGPHCELFAFDNSKISIGKGSIFAKQCMIRTSDSHIIQDSEGNVINQSSDISIGSHVWLGQNTYILKGSSVLDGCVVGARSTITVSTKAEQNSILVGQPAKIIKNNIRWKL